MIVPCLKHNYVVLQDTGEYGQSSETDWEWCRRCGILRRNRDDRFLRTPELHTDPFTVEERQRYEEAKRAGMDGK